MPSFKKMTLDEVIARLQNLRTKIGGDAHVVIRGAALKHVRYVDAIGFVTVGKGNPDHVVSRGGVPVVRVYAQGD